jgi:hypothetical protein
VSPSWAETIEATLHPTLVRVARRSLFGRQAAPPSSTQVAPDTVGAAGHEAWRAALATLDDALRRAGVSGRALRVAVSDHFVRYTLIPWSSELVADSERLAFSQLSMREVFGAAADSWALCLGDQPAGQPVFCAAVDASLLSALRDLAAKHRLRLRSVVPMLSLRVQRHRRSLKERAFCFASLEPGRMTLAFHGAHGWDAVRGRRVANGVVEELAGALRQEAAAAGAGATGTLYLAGEDLAQPAPSSVAGWKVVRLEEAVGGPGRLGGARAAVARG